MRLKKLKLAGFKSFVDPTTVDFPSPLVGVLGPNGCGKSNIIDAVRWVMGESSAKNLRGESMTDVIFNGSRDRKPLGQASVELIFENDQGRLLGEYAAYTEISIKRIVTREAVSTYYINGGRCRRKDVTDIFLGTGLGPRSYSIIGQGTISRIIEAKPEELRIFLEEAAGISKYKEKRRETQNRIRHTEENLARVCDIRDELQKQLERLERQAKAAEKYKRLKQEERRFRDEFHALKWQSMSQQITELDKRLSENRVRIEEYLAEQSRLDNEMEAKQQSFEDANENVNKTQAVYYQLAADIARLEETLSSQRARKKQLEDDLEEARSECHKAQSHYDMLDEKCRHLVDALERIKPLVSNLKEDFEAKQNSLQSSEKEKEDWQLKWDEFNRTAAETSKMAHVEQTRIQQLEEQIGGIQQRIDKLLEEKRSLDLEPLEKELDEAVADKSVVEGEQATLSTKVTDINERLSALREKEKTIKQELARQFDEIQGLKEQRTSLNALQEVALGKHDKGAKDWLAEHQLEGARRVAELIDIDSGWEKAVELVLADKLQALCVDGSNDYLKAIDSLKEGTLMFVETEQTLRAAVTSAGTPLYKKVSSDLNVVKNLLSGIYVADDVDSAVGMLGSIGANESVVSKDGLWLGHGWLRCSRKVDEEAGIIVREKTLKALEKQLSTEEQSYEARQNEAEQLKDEVATLEEERETAQRALNDSVSRLSEANSVIKVKQHKLDESKVRLSVIDKEHASEEEALGDAEIKLVNARGAWQQAMDGMATDSKEREHLIAERERINEELDESRFAANRARQQLHEHQIELKAKQSEFDSTQSSKTREKSRLDSLKARIESLVTAQEASKDESVSPEKQLEEKLKSHLQAEQVMQDAKLHMEDVKAALHQVDNERQEVMETVRSEQAKLDELRMDKQTLIVRRQTVEEALAEEDSDLEEIIKNLPEEAEEKAWESEIKTIEVRIQRLGAINLAAIDEYEVESERKQYLDKQHEDLTEALEMLDAAIKKIDKETRMRFKDTFDQVNDSFKYLFPKVFGGGQALLELTGEDLLDTGVSVLARPPGKRNTTIHLLSGGEKALTAIALVFAIFQLNPSPFCMLDEVDAPLDDSNVGRFCDLVKEMSEHVQFIFITHNKVTMEMAEQLLGVTMHEPGVSRVVSVDVHEALSMAT